MMQESIARLAAEIGAADLSSAALLRHAVEKRQPASLMLGGE